MKKLIGKIMVFLTNVLALLFLPAVLLLSACPRLNSETNANDRILIPEDGTTTRTPEARPRGFPERVEGVVEHVSDGDTFILRDDNGTRYTVRIQGVDAPEKGQAFGDRSKSILTTLIRRRRVRVTPTKTDQFRRLVGGVEIDGRDICLELLERGAVWHFSRFDRELPAGLGEKYEIAEATARSKRIGLWSDPDPTPPWDFRDRQRESPSR
ncbi:MAG TPA: thermonuclease family protein [Pyrinomonadaceae bacterium]|nr:thermonuclease family protein [Pyrinomonadaceae bacterium]